MHAIEYHHHPSDCPPEHRDVVYTVYIANVLADPKHREFDFEQFDQEVMSEFNVQSHDQLNTIRTRLENMFEREQMNGPESRVARRIAAVLVHSA